MVTQGDEMVVALLSDIHSNFLALEAVIEDIRKQGIENIAILGDVVGYGPRTRETLLLTKRLVEQGAKILPGNHDIDFIVKVNNIIKGISADSMAGMGKKASAAMNIQIADLLTKNPSEFLSDKYAAEIYGSQTEYSPEFFKELAKGLRKQRKKDLGFWDYVLPGILAINKIKKGDKSFAEEDAVGIWMKEQPKMANMNQESSQKIIYRDETVKAYRFLEKIAEYDGHMIVDGIHCFHSTTWDKNKPNSYILDPNQKRIIKEGGLNPEDLPHFGFGKLVELAQKLHKKEVSIAVGHLHIPSIHNEEIDGIKVTGYNPGGLGSPRFSNQYHDKAPYIVKEGSKTEIRAPEYNWEQVHQEMKDKEMPLNRIWAKLKGDS